MGCYSRAFTRKTKSFSKVTISNYPGKTKAPKMVSGNYYKNTPTKWGNI